MIDLKHPLAVLGNRLPWNKIEESLAPLFTHKDREGQRIEGDDLLGSVMVVAGAGVSNAGRQRLSIRLMASLLYLKNSFNLSDEELVARWSENVVWQYFSGQEYYEPRLPCDATQIGRFRRAIGEDGLEKLLKFTIETAVEIKAVKRNEFERVIVDTTVQEKAIAHPVQPPAGDCAPQGGEHGQACRDHSQADFRQGRQRTAPQGRGLRARQAVSAIEEDSQAPAHDPGRGDA